MIHIKEYGAKDGEPVVFFHGFPGSHIQASLLDSIGQDIGARVLAVDRPGYGFSSPIETDNLTNFVKQLGKTLEELKLQEFFLVGVSGGNAAALSAASFFKDKVKGLASVCGVAPLKLAPETYPEKPRKWLTSTRLMPLFILKPLIDSFIKGVKVEDQLIKLIERLPKVDQEALKGDNIFPTMMASVEMGRRQGSEGIIFDLRSFANEWPVDWAELKMPYSIWHGESDTIVLPSSAAYLHRQVPQSKLNLLPNVGHYSLPLGYGREILSDLLASAKK